jgi:hypothetical protein
MHKNVGWYRFPPNGNDQVRGGCQKILKAIWEISFEMWEHRNRVLHHLSHPWNQKKTRDRDAQILAEVAGCRKPAYLKKDRRFYHHTAEHLCLIIRTSRKSNGLNPLPKQR